MYREACRRRAHGVCGAIPPGLECERVRSSGARKRTLTRMMSLSKPCTSTSTGLMSCTERGRSLSTHAASSCASQCTLQDGAPKIVGLDQETASICTAWQSAGTAQSIQRSQKASRSKSILQQTLIRILESADMVDYLSVQPSDQKRCKHSQYVAVTSARLK